MSKDKTPLGRRLAQFLIQIRMVWIVVELLCVSQFVMATLDAMKITNFGYPPNSNWLWLGSGILMTALAVAAYCWGKKILVQLEK